MRLPQVDGSPNSRRIERRRKEKQKVGTSEFLGEGGGGNNIVLWTDVGSKDPLTYVFVAEYVEQFLDLTINITPNSNLATLSCTQTPSSYNAIISNLTD